MGNSGAALATYSTGHCGI